MDYAFVGPSYQGRALNADSERSINLYLEKVESVNGKVRVILVGSPGKTLFATLPLTGFRGIHVVRGNPDRLFAVALNTLYEIFADGTYIARGSLISVSGFVGMDNNPYQLMICDGAKGYILTLATNSYQQIISAGFTSAGQVAFIDSYFAVNQINSALWNISQPEDGTTWDGADVATKEGSPDNILAIVNLHRQLFFFGQKTTEVWYDTGAATFPFAPIPGVFIEKGIAAPFSLSKTDNTVAWVGAEDNGWLVVYKMNGYTPQRISTHAVEYSLNKEFGTPSLINGYAYQEEGHDFYVLNSPTAGTTWVYDSAEMQWHERQSFNEAGKRDRDRASFHAFVFGFHLMFDYTNGDVYSSSLDVYTSNGNPHPRIRIGPHSKSDLRYQFFKHFQVDMQTGVGLDGTQQGTNPVAILKLSNDGGRTWGSEKYKSIGKIGQTKARVRWTQLGRARDRVFWFEIDDPVKVILLSSDVDSSIGNA